MMMNQKLSVYKQIRKSLSLSLKLQLYFSMLQNTLTENVKNLPFFSNKKFEQPIAQIFLKLTQQQKAIYLLEMITFIKNQYQNEQESIIKQKSSQKSLSTIQQIINTIQTSAHMEQTKMKIPYWNEVRFKFNKIQRTVQITTKKKSFKLNLRLYLIRKSHSVDYCIVFQTLKDDITNQLKSLHFIFQKQIYLPLWNQLYKVVIKSRKEQLYLMMKEDNMENDGKINSIQCCQNYDKNLDKTLVFLSVKSIAKYQKYRDSVIKRLQVGKFDFQTELSEDLYQHPFIKSFKIQRSQRATNLFKLQVILTRSSSDIKHQFIQAYKQKFKYVLMSTILQKKSKYQAIYQKFLLKNNKVHEVISIRQCLRPEFDQKQNILFIKGIQHIISKEYVQFILSKVKKINQVQSKLIVVGSFVVDQFFNVDVIIKYLLEFKDMLYRDKRKKTEEFDNLSEEEFFSICSELSYQDIQLEEGEGKCEEESQDEEKEMKTSSQRKKIDQNKQKQIKDINNQNIIPQKSIQRVQIKTKNYLNVNHQTKYEQTTNILMKQHYLFKDWTRVKHGGVACYNEEIIGQQKKLFKKIITKMGSNLLKGNGILNISLPVDVFKKETQLTSIAKDFCYAPIFIEKGIKSNSPLQRIKYATLQTISVGNLGISMQKPFNPILGETLQCWIDNCPIYLQQISHHPPISSYFLVGRGYRIDGQIQSKISVGMNTAKGYSDKPNHIIFQDGSKMTMVYGKMLIKGMLFGERQFTFEDKIFVYDQTNHLFSQISYGPRKKSKDPNDFISGKIYKLKESFKNKFYLNNQNHYPNHDDIINQLSSFQGIWTESIKFDNKEYVNFKTELPYDLIDQKYPLESNSLYRTDLIKLIEDNIEEAQKYKQLMEEEQRKDRKLRQKYKKQRI